MYLDCGLKLYLLNRKEKIKMKIGDIYKHKENNSIIRIDSFATPMGRFCESKHIIIFRQIEKCDDEFGSLPSFNGYGTQEEIEAEYQLLVPQEEVQNYSGWDEIFNLIKKGENQNENHGDQFKN